MKNWKDYFPIALSSVALTLSLATFIIQWVDRQRELVEKAPVLGFEFRPPSYFDEYGYYLENRGEARAHITNVEYYSDDAGEAQILLDSLNISRADYFRSSIGPDFSLSPNSRINFYTFNKKLTEDESSVFRKYSELIYANICYCDSANKNCKVYVVARDPKIINSGPNSEFACST